MLISLLILISEARALNTDRADLAADPDLAIRLARVHQDLHRDYHFGRPRDVGRRRGSTPD